MAAPLDIKALKDMATNGALLNQALSGLINNLDQMVLPADHGGTGQSYGGIIPRYTTAERDALVSPEDGLLIYNTTIEEFQGRANGAWETIILQDSPTINNPTLGAGTTALAAYKLTSGTNLTTAVAGSWEYDGKTAMFTPIGTQRGVVPALQTFRLNANLSGANSTAVQSILGVGVSLSASTVYEFALAFALTKSAGTTSHTISVGFGGTATLTNITWTNVSTPTPAAPGTGATSSQNYATAATAVVLTNAITTASVRFVCVIRGTVSVNAAGTFTPQYKLSAAPGGAYLTNYGASMQIWPIGASGSNTSVGTWA